MTRLLGFWVLPLAILGAACHERGKPTASFTRSVVDFTVSVDGSGSTDTDGTIVSYEWDWGDGTPTDSGVTASHTYASAGTFTVTLTVTDDDGKTRRSSQPVTTPNQAPVPSFTRSWVNLTVSVDGSGSTDADGTIESYEWDWGDGTPTDSGVTASHTYASAGTFTLMLTVTDDQGAQASTSQPVTTPNQAPVAVIQPLGHSGLTVLYHGLFSSDADGTIVSHVWDWGDGSPDTSAAVAAHTYATAGQTFPVTLTVTDDDGAMGTASVDFTAPTVQSFTLSPATAEIREGQSQQFVLTILWSDGSTTFTGTWASSDPLVATVGDTGLATAVGAGTTTITASAFGFSTSATLTVGDVTFAPEPNYAVHVGATLTFSVGPASLGITASELPSGASFDGTTFSWAPTKQQAMQSDEPGAFRDGRYTVTFTTAGGTAVDVKIGVSQDELVSLFTSDLTIGIGAQGIAVIESTFSDGSTALGSVFNPITPSWETADPAIAFVSKILPDGTIAFVQSVERGTTTLTSRVTSATLGELSTTAAVSVLGVTSIAIDPPLLDLPQGASEELQATATLEDGSPSTAVPFAWSSSDPGTVSVSAAPGGQGILVGEALGSATITATADNVSAFADVTVVPPLRALSFFGLDVLPPSVGDSRFVVLDTVGGAQAHATLLGPYFMEETDSNGLNELVVSGLEATTFQTVFQKVDALGAVTIAHQIPIPPGQEQDPDFVTDIRLQDDGTIYVAADDGTYTFSTVSPSGQLSHIGEPSGSTGFGGGTLGLAGGDVVYTGPWDFEYTQGATIIGTASLVGLYDAAQSGQQQHVPVAVAGSVPGVDSMVAPGGLLHVVDGPSGVVYRFVDLDGDGDHFFLQDSLDELGNPVREALDDPGERELFANLPLADFRLRADLTTGALFAVRVTGVDPKRVLVLELIDLNGDGDADDAGEQVVVFDAAAPAGTSIGGVDLLH